ncbi:glycoside hydrolase family 28 [Pseudopedobacter saltans DSM 12145]|uniref:Glycoside hydrolase family 28 n=1 Tax=Pseudopedobacter saltans (strain ATCC 51119 / DSM 12145 / JCM 21818 / CCUG 39354 / LMG 10337 / NBRC 100064 / NCIMB 13643) TaxID=762903 RepID=F0S974_PSESL|nr:glycoside hydrolase family 28 [Pseudopedobacter saltans DSM 12145]
MMFLFFKESKIFGYNENDIVLYPVVKSAERSILFSTKTNGVSVFTEKFRDISYANFAHNRPASIEVKVEEKILNWDISPKKNIKMARMVGNSVQFNLEKPGFHVLTINNKHRYFLLADKKEKGISATPKAKIIDIKSYGVDSTGNKVETKLIQRALDETARDKKILVFSSGIYRTGTLKISSNANIYLAPGAVIKGSDDRNDYPADGNKKESDHVNDKANFTDNGEWMTFSRLILIGEAENVRIWGSGIIDGNGRVVRAQGKPANLIRIRNSRNVTIEGIMLRDPASWNTHILKSENITIRNVKILNDREVANTDGFDPDASQNVKIDNCFAYCGDDSIAIKNTNNSDLIQDCDNIVIKNSVFITKKSALKVGTETKGNTMKNILFKNNTILEGDRGMVLYCYDGAGFRNIKFLGNSFEKGYKSKNLKILHFEILSRNGQGSIKDILIKNSRVSSSFSTISEISGLNNEHTVSGVRFKNFRLDGKMCSTPQDIGLKANQFVKNLKITK